MKKIVITLAVMFMLAGCTMRPKENEYQKLYDLNNDLSRYHISLFSRIRYVYDDSTVTTDSESEIYFDRDAGYVDLNMKIYQQYDMFEEHYHLENGILTTDHGESEGTISDLEPLIETIRLMLPEIEYVKSFSVDIFDGSYNFDVLALEDFWDKVSAVHSGDVVEEFECELEESSLLITADKYYSIIAEDIDYTLLVKDTHPYHICVQISLFVLPYEK